MADSRHFNDFQDGGGGHLWNWRYPSATVFFRTQHVYFSLCTKFHQNRAINGRLTPFNWFSIWRRRPSLKMAAHFRFRDFWTQCEFFGVCTKLHQNRAIFAHFAAWSRFSRWRRRPSWKMAADPRFAFFELSMCFYVCVPNFIKIGWYLAIL